MLKISPAQLFACLQSPNKEFSADEAEAYFERNIGAGYLPHLRHYRAAAKLLEAHKSDRFTPEMALCLHDVLVVDRRPLTIHHLATADLRDGLLEGEKLEAWNKVAGLLNRAVRLANAIPPAKLVHVLEGGLLPARWAPTATPLSTRGLDRSKQEYLEEAGLVLGNALRDGAVDIRGTVFQHTRLTLLQVMDFLASIRVGYLNGICSKIPSISPPGGRLFPFKGDNPAVSRYFITAATTLVDNLGLRFMPCPGLPEVDRISPMHDRDMGRPLSPHVVKAIDQMAGVLGQAAAEAGHPVPSGIMASIRQSLVASLDCYVGFLANAPSKVPPVVPGDLLGGMVDGDLAVLFQDKRVSWTYTNLSGLDLSGLDLSGLDFTGALLCGANLRGTDLRYSHLKGADLTGADLTGADLEGTLPILKNAIITDAKGLEDIPGDLPEMDLAGTSIPAAGMEP